MGICWNQTVQTTLVPPERTTTQKHVESKTYSLTHPATNHTSESWRQVVSVQVPTRALGRHPCPAHPHSIDQQLQVPSVTSQSCFLWMVFPETKPLILSDAIMSAQYSATRSAAYSSFQDNPASAGGPFFIRNGKGRVCVLLPTQTTVFSWVPKGPSQTHPLFLCVLARLCSAPSSKEHHLTWLHKSSLIILQKSEHRGRSNPSRRWNQKPTQLITSI